MAPPKPSSHEHAAACFFEDQGLSGFQGNETNSLKLTTAGLWVVATLGLWVSLDGLWMGLAFQTQVAVSSLGSCPCCPLLQLSRHRLQSLPSTVHVVVPGALLHRSDSPGRMPHVLHQSMRLLLSCSITGLYHQISEMEANLLEFVETA